MAKKYPEAITHQIGFCPGCGHGIIVRLIAECVEELGIRHNFIFNIGVGCSSLIEGNIDYDYIVADHGGNGAIATAQKRLRPETIILNYQGDGDAYVIGLSQTLNAAYRNENITVITVNNTNFGMTGGQMGWTTMPGQKTVTCSKGRDTSKTGLPIKVPELIANSESFDVAYVARGTVTSPAEISKTKRYIKKALQNQIDRKGYSLVEIVSPCPTNWHLSELKAMERVTNELIPYYTLGEMKVKED